MSESSSSDELTEAIEQAAITGIKKVTGDTGSTEMMPIDERIKAIRFADARRASRSGLGIRTVKLIPPGQD